MENPKISVLISMYKGEKTVKRMIDCILAQTFSDFELILIDDGSPDNCGAIADEYAKSDSRIRVIHKPNGGLADARNEGLKIACGEYTIQFDQDDFVDQDAFEELYKKAKQEDADMVICDHYSNDEYRQMYVEQKPSALTAKSVLLDIALGKLAGYCWNKLIRLECYKKYNIKFPLEIYGCEDQYAMCDMLKNDIKIAYLPKAFCHYVFTLGSLSRHYDDGTFKNDVKVLTMFCELLKDTDAYECVRRDKAANIAKRAFMFGSDFYSSKEYATLFDKYKEDVMETTASRVDKFMFEMSFKGYYRPMRHLFQLLFDTKQLLKRVRIIK